VSLSCPIQNEFFRIVRIWHRQFEHSESEIKNYSRLIRLFVVRRSYMHHNTIQILQLNADICIKKIFHSDSRSSYPPWENLSGKSGIIPKNSLKLFFFSLTLSSMMIIISAFLWTKSFGILTNSGKSSYIVLIAFILEHLHSVSSYFPLSDNFFRLHILFYPLFTYLQQTNVFNIFNDSSEINCGRVPLEGIKGFSVNELCEFDEL